VPMHFIKATIIIAMSTIETIYARQFKGKITFKNSEGEYVNQGFFSMFEDETFPDEGTIEPISTKTPMFYDTDCSEEEEHDGILYNENDKGYIHKLYNGFKEKTRGVIRYFTPKPYAKRLGTEVEGLFSELVQVDRKEAIKRLFLFYKSLEDVVLYEDETEIIEEELIEEGVFRDQEDFKTFSLNTLNDLSVSLQTDFISEGE
jgi:hypothetical protein